jgi:Lecithin retinol acyltransferase
MLHGAFTCRSTVCGSGSRAPSKAAGRHAAVYCETRMFGRSVRSTDGLRSSDLALSPEREPPLGAHVVTPRRGYSHHGIYVGQGRVVQYGGLSRGLRRGPVEEVSLSQFAQGRPICHRPGESRWFDPHEVVRRARMRLGENRYNVLTNNCEHFCEWCVRGEHRSYQVDDIIARCSRGWRGLTQVLVR